MIQDIGKLREQVRQRLEQEKLTYQTREDKHRKPVEFNIGEIILLKYPKKVHRGQSKKFIPHYVGKHEVLKKLNDLTYLVKNLRPGREIKANVERMRFL